MTMTENGSMHANMGANKKISILAAYSKIPSNATADELRENRPKQGERFRSLGDG